MTEKTFTEATREALADAMDADPAIFVVGEGAGERGGNFETTAGLYEKHGPLRLCDTPICERGFIGMCTGAAMTGARPVVDFMFTDFILDGLGELINQTSKMQYMSNGRLKMPMVLRGCIGIGHSAATHHSGSYYPLFVHIPGFRVGTAVQSRGRQGPVRHGAAQRGSRFLHGAPPSAEPEGTRAGRRAPGALRAGRGGSRGDRRHGRGAHRHGPPCPSGRGGTGRRGDFPGDHRSAHRGALDVDTSSRPCGRPAGCSSWTRPSCRAGSARRFPPA